MEKYFTPSIEDIRVGYECEHLYKHHKIVNDESIYREEWCNITVEIDSRLKAWNDYIQEGRLRVPYLTKEQIEAEGWKFKGKSIDLWWEKEGNFEIGSWTSYKIVIHYGMKGHVGNQDCRLYIHADDRGDEHRLFEGECKDINTFRQIMKLLGI